MKRIFPLVLLCAALAGCLDRATIASASALPAYDAVAQATIDRAKAKPYTDAEKATIKALDDKAFAALGAINAEEMRKATALHEQVQGL